MSTGKNIALIGSNVILSVLVMSVVSIFILPPIIADLNPSSNGSSENGIVLQSKYQTYNTRADLFDNDPIGYVLMPNTTMLITIQSQSRISAVFSGFYWLSIQGLNAGDRVKFNISLNIGGVVQRVTWIRYDTTAYTITQELSGNHLYLNYVTDPLPAGTYNISVLWTPEEDHVGTSRITFNWDPDDPPYLRSLWVQELA